MIRLIAFDVGGVYLRWTPRKYLRAMRRLTGAGSAKIHAGLTKKIHEFHVQAVTEKEYWKAFCSEAGVNVPMTRLRRTTADHLFAPNRSVARIARRLRGKYRTALFGNQTVLLDRLDKQWGIYKEFDYNISSHIVKLEKPHAPIFKRLLCTARVKPREVLLIDDQRKNIDTALRMGMDAILYKSASQLAKGLRKRRPIP